MLEYIIGIVCVVVIGIVCWYFYSKISKQETTINQLIVGYKNLAGVIMKPQPRQEINSLFNQQPIDDCNSCMIAPVKPEVTVNTRKIEENLQPNMQKNIDPTNFGKLLPNSENEPDLVTNTLLDTVVAENP